MFERSKSGQENRSRLLGSDYVCYVEGGSDDVQAHDITYWQTVFKILKPTLKIKFVARGGKPVLERLAREMVDKDISNVIVAMDADYDHLTAETISDHRIFYTRGYSWENDAFHSANLENIYKALCHCGTVPHSVAEQIGTHYARLLKELRWPTQADHIALRAGTSVFPRQSPGRVIKVPPGQTEPVVDTAEILKFIQIAKQRRKASLPVFRVRDTARFCVGHVYELAMIYLIKMVAKAFGGKSSVSPDHIRDVCLQTLPELLKSGAGDIYLYHQAQCARILA